MPPSHSRWSCCIRIRVACGGIRIRDAFGGIRIRVAFGGIRIRVALWHTHSRRLSVTCVFAWLS